MSMKKMIEHLFPPTIGTRVRVISRRSLGGREEMKRILENVFGSFPYYGEIVEISRGLDGNVISYGIEASVARFPIRKRKLILTYFREEFEVVM